MSLVCTIVACAVAAGLAYLAVCRIGKAMFMNNIGK
jgi:hypothetical protein